jgi:hypothetical protein
VTGQPRAGPGRLAALALVVLVCGARPAEAGLTDVHRLAAVYDSILDARFEEAATQLHATCPPAPAEACRALEAVSLWWQILITPDDHSLDERLERASAEAIAAADAWTHREPQRAEAWFYLAGAYAPRVQLHVLRKNTFRAALDGNRIRAALERALQLDPSLADAYFGIGLYHYYAAIAPPVARLLRRLLFLPGGDRAQGLREITEARTRGDLLRGEADYQLLVLDLWYEGKPAEAMDLLAGLDRRYSHNPLFRARMATVSDEYLHDHAASATARSRRRGS